MSVVQLNYQSLCCSSACRTLNYLFPMRAIKVQNIGPLNWSAPTTTTTTHKLKHFFKKKKCIIAVVPLVPPTLHKAGQQLMTTATGLACVSFHSFTHVLYIHSLIGPVEALLQKEADSLKRTVSLCFLCEQQSPTLSHYNLRV